MALTEKAVDNSLIELIKKERGGFVTKSSQIPKSNDTAKGNAAYLSR